MDLQSRQITPTKGADIAYTKHPRANMYPIFPSGTPRFKSLTERILSKNSMKTMARMEDVIATMTLLFVKNILQ